MRNQTMSTAASHNESLELVGIETAEFRTIQITSTCACEITERFMVKNDMYERFISELSSIEKLEDEEQTESLVEIYCELKDGAEKIEHVRFREIDTPTCINNIVLR